MVIAPRFLMKDDYSSLHIAAVAPEEPIKSKSNRCCFSERLRACVAPPRRHW
jgi:hypothetical protein